jgi:UDP-N-acetylmuramate: L-alanyl-gamma-D-glutamyl-meso-diaminopimelate ligase
MVVEGDEYDTAFFDKGSKFLHYDPFMTILIRVEFDHADIFKDLEHVRQTFHRFLSGLSRESALFVYDNDDNIAGLVQDLKCDVVSYGKDKQSAWRLGDVSVTPPQTTFDVIKGGTLFGTFTGPFIGEYNLLNTVSAIAVADRLGIPAETIADALKRFKGIKRRQEIRGEKRGITVMDDFAHHPTAVRETIWGVKPFYPEGRVIAVFEPRTQSSMRNVFQSVYPHSFEGADLICVREPSLLAKIPPDERFSSEKLVADLKDGGKPAHYFPDTESIIEFLLSSARSGDVVLIMSNGGFDNIHERLLAAL